ncbi:1-aminocyclopropane-1-carboxylate oxidase homolog 1-like isoform X2 [Curcuma longa]|uniref:1-aminocyclopropane-1-carboxylate oxidase homolog 1-like isoform X2 n=1 Tax=Curcuma longa TaxID=136217 RepID=UPI003D9F1839
MEIVNDRLADLKAFDATKSGVQGLVARGASEVPRIFQWIGEHQPALGHVEMDHQAAVPVIDLAGSRREEAVAEIRRACQEWGFFQLVGHGVPPGAMEDALVGVRAFHEGDPEVKAALYSRDRLRAAKYSSNFDLYASRVANWRDTLYCRMLPDPPKAEELPQSCREALFEYSKHIGKLGKTLFELLSEALGLNPSYLEEMECNQGQILLCHYFPPCPEPEVAIGTSAHSDPGFLTVLLQDHIGGLQVLHNDKWVEVPPIPGALVINIADLLQLISNDRFKSVEHRVVANREGPRISIACFFSTHFHPCSTRLYGPIKELISEENPPLYKEIMVRDYVAYYYSRGLDGKSTISHFRLS